MQHILRITLFVKIKRLFAIFTKFNESMLFNFQALFINS